jgi:hypothetical protein
MVCNLSAQVIPKDKQLHLYCGVSAGAWCYAVGQDKKPVLYGITGAALAGIGKETYDKINGNKFDCKDLGFTILGGAISVTVIELIKRGVNKKRVKKLHPLIS